MASTASFVRSAALALVVVAGCKPEAPAPPAPSGEQAIELGAELQLESTVLGQTRSLSVYLPWGYGQRDKRYPVLYLIDGGPAQDYVPVAGFAALASLTGQYREFILVGIETVDRRYELTSPSSVPFDVEQIPNNGGAQDFRRFIREEVQPFIEQRYRTTGERAVMGESLAGLFIVETFVHEPESFDHYIAVSPSLWWREGELVTKAERALSELPPERSLFLASADEVDIVAKVERLAALLEAHAPAELRWWYAPMPAEHHNTIYHPAALEALRRVFGPAPADAPRARPELPEACSPESMRGCFDDPQHIAGRAQLADKGVDGWRPAFEGGPALEAELSRPHFVQADATGDIFVADKDAHAVRLISTTGRITTLASAPDLRSPNGLWVHPNGRAYVLDLGHSAVERLDKSGALERLFEVAEGIRLGRGIWVAPDESLAYLSSGAKVLRWTPARGVETFAEGFAGLGNLIVDPSGALVVTDRSAGQVFRVGEDGAKTRIAGSGAPAGGGHGELATASSLPGVRALWFDDAGGLFLGTHESSAIWYVDPSGRLQEFLRAPELSEVRGLSLDHAGNLLIVDHDGGRVWRLARRP